MTAEIVIMNKEAVALAADSAMSLIAGPGDRPQKVFTAANKIFELSSDRPVSIMIFNRYYSAITLLISHTFFEKKASNNPFTVVIGIHFHASNQIARVKPRA